MAQLSNEEFYDKWVPLLADNVFQDIDGKRLEQLLADMRDTFAPVASANAQPVAPAVNFDPGLRQLTATHPLGVGELEYNHNNGGFTPYTPLQVDDLGHAQGEWRYRVKGDVGRNPSQATDSPLIDKKSVVSPAGPGTIKSTDISDSTEAGRALLVAKDVAAQRQLLDKFVIVAGQYGVGQPRFEHVAGEDGLYAYVLRALAGAAAPKAPTMGQVDDTADTFSLLPNPLFPSFAQYKVNGLPGVTGAVVLDATNSYVSAGRIIIKVVGAVAKGGLAVYVAGSGTVPDGNVLTNADPFTGAAVVTPPVSTNTPPAVSANAQVTGTSVKLTGLATDADGIASIFLKVFDSLGAVVQTFGPSVPGDMQYVTVWPSATAGAYTVRAIATDSKGLPATSDALSFTVSATAPPTGKGYQATYTDIIPADA